MYQVRAADQVIKEIKNFPIEVRRQLRLALLNLSHDPFPAGCKKLSGNLAGFLRIRVGAYRAIYKTDSPSKIVTIVKVGPRKDVYR